MSEHVIIETRGQDNHEWTIGDVFLLDGRHLNKELVKAGLAWWFCRHSSEAELKQLEDEAREANRGLWKDAVPTPPWIYRRLPRIQGPEVSEFDCPEPSYQLIHQQTAATAKEFDIIGNRRNHIYRRVDCPGYDLVSEDHRIAFVSVDAAEQAGYRLDWKCP